MPHSRRTAQTVQTLAEPLVAGLQQRGMALPALLFVTAHRPLAFAAGHLLAVAAPLAAVLGAARWMQWSQLLSTHEGVDGVLAALAAHEQPPPRQGEGTQ